MQTLVDFATRFDPRLPERLRPADAAQLAELERLCGLRLPPSYADLLMRMGRNMEWLQPAGRTLRIEPLLAHYRLEPWRPPPGYLKIGLGTQDPFFDIYLRARGTPEACVVSLPRGPAADFNIYKRAFRHTLAGTLEEYLGTWVYRTAGLTRHGHAARLAGQDAANDLLPKVAPVLAGFDLSPVWFSSDWVQVYVGETCGAIATQFPGGVLSMELAARDAYSLIALQDALSGAISLPHRFAIRGGGI
ncbi:MAG: SMI1/KNR4 family protein [Rhodocyclaceae bacterium]|nr:SMI1/KNR4 family protein [Rhodocyclaceae bacterium]MBX3669489.1 SMI1/KNR4 family protein [Rhodocyclaceae bacterium]